MSTHALRLIRIFATTFAVVILGQLGTGQALAAPEDFAIESVDAEVSTKQAGAHSDFFTSFKLATDPDSAPNGFGLKAPYAITRDIEVVLPPGLSGNPEALPIKCTSAQLLSSLSLDPGVGCPNASQIGVSRIVGYGLMMVFVEPVYLMEPVGKDVVARFGLFAGIYPTFINVKLRPELGNRLTATIVNATTEGKLVQADTTIWGVPADPVHDTQRHTIAEAFQGVVGSVPRPPGGGAPEAFMSNPTSCGSGKEVGFNIRPWEVPDLIASASGQLSPFTGCDLLSFSPTMDFVPTTTRADSSTGMDVTLKLPQEQITNPEGKVHAHLKKAEVVLPRGMSLNPSAADGLNSCSPGQIGLISTEPISFNSDPVSCPNASKVGTAELKTPLLPDPVSGDLYVAEQGDNPFNSLLAGYMVLEGQGLRIKLAGNFDRDPSTGQLTAIFDNNPEQPFSELKLHFKGGSRGVLATPPTCGTYEITSKLSPWSASDPNNPSPAEIVTQKSSFKIDRAADGGPCTAGNPNQPGNPADLSNRPFNPKMAAGTISNRASSYTPFTFNLARPDGDQELSSLQIQMPEGVTAKLAGVSQCSDAVLALISQTEGTGAAENQNPSCPASAQVGKVTVGAGAGPTPVYVSTGKAYLAGPYKGAPLSLAAVVPAISGPFDLGTTVVRNKLNVDPRTAQVSVESDAFPQILHGIPLRIKDVRVSVNRADFIKAPTNCDPMTVEAEIQASHGASASLTNPYQVGDCAALAFNPTLKLDFGKGKRSTKRNAHPPLNATLDFNDGDANIKRVEVALPRGILLDQERIGRICSRAHYAAGTCPESSRLGYAKAETPLLDEPLEGPVYLKASDNPLPDLAADLDGIVEIDLFGRIDQKKNKNGINQIRNTFDVVPDVPVSHFELTLEGGSDGLLVNSRNLCANTVARKLSIAIDAHNGRTLSESPLVGTACKGKGNAKNKKKAKKLNKKAAKLLKQAKKTKNKKKAKQLRKQARKLKQQARKLGR